MKQFILYFLSAMLIILTGCQKNEVVEPAPRQLEPFFQCGDPGHIRIKVFDYDTGYVSLVTSTSTFSVSCLSDTISNDISVQDSAEYGRLFQSGEYCLFSSTISSISFAASVGEIQFFDLQLVGFNTQVNVENTQVNEIDLSRVSGAERFTIRYNSNLTSVNLPAPSQVPSLMTIDFKDNALNATSVDNAIIMAATAHEAGVPIQQVYLDGGTNASPTSASLNEFNYLNSQVEIDFRTNP